MKYNGVEVELPPHCPFTDTSVISEKARAYIYLACWELESARRIKNGFETGESEVRKIRWVQAILNGEKK